MLAAKEIAIFLQDVFFDFAPAKQVKGRRYTDQPRPSVSLDGNGRDTKVGLRLAFNGEPNKLLTPWGTLWFGVRSWTGCGDQNKEMDACTEALGLVCVNKGSSLYPMAFDITKWKGQVIPRVVLNSATWVDSMKNEKKWKALVESIESKVEPAKIESKVETKVETAEVETIKVETPKVDLREIDKYLVHAFGQGAFSWNLDPKNITCDLGTYEYKTNPKILWNAALERPIFFGKVVISIDKNVDNRYLSIEWAIGQEGKSINLKEFIELAKQKFTSEATFKEMRALGTNQYTVAARYGIHDMRQSSFRPKVADCLYPCVRHDKDAFLEKESEGRYLWKLSDVTKPEESGGSDNYNYWGNY